MKFPRQETDALLAWMQEQLCKPEAHEDWSGNDYDRMKEAADFLKDLLAHEAMKRIMDTPPLVGEQEILEYARVHGARSAADLLLLVGPDGFDGDYYKVEAYLKQESDKAE